MSDLEFVTVENAEGIAELTASLFPEHTIDDVRFEHVVVIGFLTAKYPEISSEAANFAAKLMRERKTNNEQGI